MVSLSGWLVALVTRRHNHWQLWRDCAQKGVLAPAGGGAGRAAVWSQGTCPCWAAAVAAVPSGGPGLCQGPVQGPPLSPGPGSPSSSCTNWPPTARASSWGQEPAGAATEWGGEEACGGEDGSDGQVNLGCLLWKGDSIKLRAPSSSQPCRPRATGLTFPSTWLGAIAAAGNVPSALKHIADWSGHPPAPRASVGMTMRALMLAVMGTL